MSDEDLALVICSFFSPKCMSLLVPHGHFPPPHLLLSDGREDLPQARPRRTPEGHRRRLRHQGVRDRGQPQGGYCCYPLCRFRCHFFTVIVCHLGHQELSSLLCSTSLSWPSLSLYFELASYMLLSALLSRASCQNLKRGTRSALLHLW